MKHGIPYKIYGGLKFYSRKIKDVIAWLRIIQNSNDDISLSRIINVPKRGIGKTTLERIAEYAANENVSMYKITLLPLIFRRLPVLPEHRNSSFRGRNENAGTKN